MFLVTRLCGSFYEEQKDFPLLDFGAGFEICMRMLEDGMQVGFGFVWLCSSPVIPLPLQRLSQVILCPRGRRKIQSTTKLRTNGCFETLTFESGFSLSIDTGGDG